jgi:hypothetical protein
MALQLSVAVRNAMLDAIETTIGTSAVLKIRTGAPRLRWRRPIAARFWRRSPCPPTGWARGVGRVEGQVGHVGRRERPTRPARRPTTAFTPRTARRRTCKGTVTATGGGGDLVVDNAVFAAGQSFSITSWSITARTARHESTSCGRR